MCLMWLVTLATWYVLIVFISLMVLSFASVKLKQSSWGRGNFYFGREYARACCFFEGHVSYFSLQKLLNDHICSKNSEEGRKAFPQGHPLPRHHSLVFVVKPCICFSKIISCYIICFSLWIRNHGEPWKTKKFYTGPSPLVSVRAIQLKGLIIPPSKADSKSDCC